MKRVALSRSARHRSDADIRDEMARMRTRGGLPRHLAIVMDGNRRYAHSRGYPAAVGHLRGKARLEQTIRWVLCDLRIPCLTVYALSLDNISKRAPEELDQLFGLIAQGLDELRTSDDIAESGIRVKVAGALHALPASAENVRRAAEAVEAATHAGGSGGLLTICIAYGGREDLVEAARKTLEKAYKKIDNFEALMDDDAILFLRAREEGTSVVSDDFLTSSAGIQIGLWAEELEVYTNREDCEVSQTEGGAWCH